MNLLSNAYFRKLVLVSIANAGASSGVIWVFDAGSRRLLLGRGRPRRWSESVVPSVQPGARISMLDVRDDGTALLASREVDPVGPTETTLLISVRDGKAFVLDSLLHSGGEMRLSASSGQGTVVIQQPWAYSDFAVVSRDDGALTVLRQRPSQHGDIATVVTVQRYNSKRERVAMQSLSFPRTAVDESQVHTWMRRVLRDSLATFLGGRSLAEERVREALYRPSHMPAIRRVLAGSRGELFLERVTTDSMHNWEVWDSVGRRRGAFNVRPEVVVQDASEATFVALARASTGPDTILVGDLHWGRRSRDDRE